MTPITIAAAARLLGRNPETIRRHAIAGRIPGAFQLVPGGAWHLPANIIEILQTTRGPALRTQEEACQSASEERHGGSTSPRRTAAELDILLQRLTKPPRKNSTTT